MRITIAFKTIMGAKESEQMLLQ